MIHRGIKREKDNQPSAELPLPENRPATTNASKRSQVKPN